MPSTGGGGQDSELWDIVYQMQSRMALLPRYTTDTRFMTDLPPSTEGDGPFWNKSYNKFMVAAQQGAGATTLAIDTVSTATAGSGTSFSWSHTVTAGKTNRLLVVLIGTDGQLSNYMQTSGVKPTVTYGGVPLTQYEHRNHASVYVSATIYYLVAPATGTATISVTNMNTTGAYGAYAVSFEGAHQTTPLGTAVEASGSSTGPSATVTTASGEIVLDIVAGAWNTTTTEGANQTARYDTTVGSAGTTGASFMGSSQAGADGGAMTWTLGDSSAWAMIAVPVKPAT